jgi:hypothetical protein
VVGSISSATQSNETSKPHDPPKQPNSAKERETIGTKTFDPPQMGGNTISPDPTDTKLEPTWPPGSMLPRDIGTSRLRFAEPAALAANARRTNLLARVLLHSRERGRIMPNPAEVVPNPLLRVNRFLQRGAAENEAASPRIRFHNTSESEKQSTAGQPELPDDEAAADPQDGSPA